MRAALEKKKNPPIFFQVGFYADLKKICAQSNNFEQGSAQLCSWAQERLPCPNRPCTGCKA